jgi:hypothetical protein
MIILLDVLENGIILLVYKLYAKEICGFFAPSCDRKDNFAERNFSTLKRKATIVQITDKTDPSCIYVSNPRGCK